MLVFIYTSKTFICKQYGNAQSILHKKQTQHTESHLVLTIDNKFRFSDPCCLNGDIALK